MSDPAAETPEPPAPQFRKTKQGKWAVMGPVATLSAALAADGKVKVLKKNGDWSDFTVVSIGRPFDVDGVEMAYGYDDEGDGGGKPPTSASAAQRGPTAEQQRSSAPPMTSTAPPPRDDSEPLPEYQGGPDDEWQGEF